MPQDPSAAAPRPDDPADRADHADPGPRTRPLAAAVLALEALLLAAVATYSLVMVASGGMGGRVGTGLGIFLGLFALAALVAARSLLARGRFGLGWGITWQLFQALVGASLLRGGLYWQGALALALAILGFVLLTRLVRSTPLPQD